MTNPALYDPWAAKADLVARISKLEPWKLGLRATSEELEGRAAYISALTKLIADHVEAMAGDAQASVSCSSAIDDTSAQGIADIGGDIAGSIARVAELEAA